MKSFAEMSTEELLRPEGWDCSCGRHHSCGLRYLRIERGAVRYLPEALHQLHLQKPFIVCDRHTKAAAWAQVQQALTEAGIPYVLYEMPMSEVEPDEYAVGCLTMSFDRSCDVILAIGSGVINDCCKVLGHAVGMPSIVVGTAPSMDGYASNSSSMIRNRVKVSLYNACPVAILADTDILCQAPERMLWAGLGDMLAKYIALCEWRISHLVIDEYYCEEIAALMRESLRQIVEAAPRLMERDPDTIGRVVRGLVLSGIAMAFAEISRPASGLEHYFSHMWEMMALDRGTPYELHGIQVGVGTVLTFRLMDSLRKNRPDRAHAEHFLETFDGAWWEKNTRRIFGKAAESILQLARDTKKNDPTSHRERMNRILDHWDDILKIMEQELPSTAQVESLMRTVGMPVKPADIGIVPQDVRDALDGSRDIRDKYLTSTMLWDLGMLYDFPLEVSYY
ncbi:MAG: sn-glycerol-1-phosphate dehydrogenase [Eubacteriales bacterium]|nr:sn-glycerol-1-phosphate dehydrogenase [Eubacteriales bacterium]